MTAATDGESLVRGYSGRMFLLIAAGVFAANLGRQALPPLLPAIIDELAITTVAAGFAITLMRLCFAALQYPSGRLSDTASRKLGIVGGLTIMALGFLLLARVDAYPLLLASTALLGIGSALFFVAERVLLSDLFVEKRGMAFGSNSAISRLGSIAAAGLAVGVLAVGTWQLAFLPVVVLIGVIALAFHYVGREGYEFTAIGVSGGATTIRATVTRVFGSGRVRWLVVAYTLIIFAWEGVLAFLPAYLQATKGFSPGFAGGGFALLFAIGVVVQPVSGRVSDRMDRRLVAGAATICSLVGLAWLILAGSLIAIIAAILIYAAGLMAFTPVLQAYLMDIFPEESKGGDLGAFKTVYEGLSSLGPTYVGVMVGLASYDVAFAGFLACLGVSAAVLFGLAIADRRSGKLNKSAT
ncbi:MAG: MFS transporter [Salinirussus sp.]